LTDTQIKTDIHVHSERPKFFITTVFAPIELGIQERENQVKPEA
jgi:hypothetical protein